MASEHVNTTQGSVQPETKVLKVRVSLKGRPIRSYAFEQNVITVGRDPDSDVHLDNPGISRHHLRIEKVPEGFVAEDLGSANGSFLNDQAMHRELLQNEDILHVGKFSLWISFDEDRRRSVSGANPVSPTTFQGTTVLSTTELEGMMSKLREADAKLDHAEASASPHPPVQSSPAAGVAVLAFLLGLFVGAGLVWYFVG